MTNSLRSIHNFADVSIIDSYKVLTVTHHNLNVNEIGNFYINLSNNTNLKSSLENLKSTHNISEIVYLETCNRVSYIFYSPEDLSDQFIKSFFCQANPELAKLNNDSLFRFVSAYEGEKAVQHVFELASSMDSMVVGEREIFKQFRNAYDKCKQLNVTGDFLRILENDTVQTAKRIYSQTKIGEKPLSIVSLAFNKLLSLNPSKEEKVLLIGAGETNALVAKFMKKYGFSNISIYNRSLDNAQEISAFLNDAPAFHLTDISEVDSFDIIFICTSANTVVVDLKLYQQMLKGDQKNKIIFDLAVPRNIAEEIVENCNVNYTDIEDLKKSSEENLNFRKTELLKAKPIISDQLGSFRRKLQKRQIEKAMSHLPHAIESIKHRALNEVFSERIETLPEESKEVLMDIMDYMEKKCVATPMKLIFEK